MAGSTLLLFLLVGRRTGLRDRMLVQASTGVPDLGSVTAVVRRVAIFTLVVEGSASSSRPWRSSVVARRPSTPSAGARSTRSRASTMRGSTSSVAFAASSRSSATRSCSGRWPCSSSWAAFGFAIVGDVAAKRRWTRLALETKVVLATTAVILVGGSVAVGVFEWSNPATLSAFPEIQRPLNAAFEATTLRTAGFSTVPTGSLIEPTLFVIMALMFIGGTSGSTAGGINVNTFSVLLVAIVSAARGRPSAEAFGRRIPHAVAYRGLSVALLSVAFVFVVGLGIEVAARTPFVQTVFEAISAFGTVGASTGITPGVPDPARLILIGAMFFGRLGPLTLVLALAARACPAATRPAVEATRIDSSLKGAT